MKTASIVAVLGKLSRRWLDKKYFFRKKAAERLVRISGFSPAMAAAMLDVTFRELTEAKLSALLRSEFGNPRCLDGFVSDKRSARRLRARGPENIVHVFAANIPNAAVWSFVFGMLLKSRNIGKLSTRDAGILDIYLDSLKIADRGLYATNKLIPSSALPSYIRKAGLVAAYGNDASLEAIRRQAPPATSFFGYGHRVSIALFTRAALKDPRLAAKAAYDVWMADQRGCLSPTTFYVEREGAAFAARLAAGLRKLQKKDTAAPRRGMIDSLGHKAMIARLKGKKTFVLESSPRGVWAVHFESGLEPALGASRQVISVRSYDRIQSVYAALEPLKDHLQCAALECGPGQKQAIAEELSALGVNRICRAGKMQIPPITWHHEGRLNLGAWVHWTDLE